jgi:hypothetical protein
MAFERSAAKPRKVNRLIAFWPSSALLAAASPQWHGPAWWLRSCTTPFLAAPGGPSRFSVQDRIPWRVSRWRFRGLSMSGRRFGARGSNWRTPKERKGASPHSSTVITRKCLGHHEASWVSLKSAIELPLTESQRRRLKDVVEYQKGRQTFLR